MAKRLPDYLRPGLDLVVVGINPGLKSAATGHHYAGAGNHFWPLMFESGLLPVKLTYEDDARVLDCGIGLTNMVDRASASVSDLSPAELRAGAVRLRAKLLRSAPAVVAFNGKRIYEVYAGRTCVFGVQPERIGSVLVFVMPSTSARTAAYQRDAKLAYFRELAAIVAAQRRSAVAS
ncbi:MAG: mismatch-specific DNA-glycosylase [Dehalococcoidia bacterium]|nr:mismatch-specific DNA-glycosylase [Dehalococcoidia bacterium]